MTPTRHALLTALLAQAVLGADAHAHGVWGHLHVTGWAVENMPDDELRAFLLDDPEVFNALLFGAVFTDTGYALDDPAARAYSEHTHWEPFIEDFVQWMLVNDPPPWDDLESRKRVAFLMGCASHGLQDTLFDSLFLHQVEQRDGAGQSQTDPGTDGFLVVDGHIRFVPQRDIPMDALLELYSGLSEEVTETLIDEAVEQVTTFYVNDGGGLVVAESFAALYEDTMPWGREHYLDPEVPGSLRAEIFPTMRYQQALWKRLNGELGADEVAVFAFPEEPRRLLSGDAERVDSWVSVVLGEGVYVDSATLELVDDAGASVAFTPAGNRWGGDPTRLLRLQPSESLEPGGWYTARLTAGAETISGRSTSEAFELRFQVSCEDEDDAACPDLGDIPVASIDGVPDEGDTGEGTGQTTAEDGGCGCAAANPRGVWWGLGLVGLGLVRRRGRQ